jgi:hypothetical protein
MRNILLPSLVSLMIFVSLMNLNVFASEERDGNWDFPFKTEYSLSGGFRSYPQSLSVTADINTSRALWDGRDKETPWKLGIVRFGADVAIHGRAGVYLDVFPIGFWQIRFAQSMTSRFYKTAGIDCETFECSGTLNRGEFGSTLALAFEAWVFVPSYQIESLSLNKTDKDFAVEGSNLLADKSGDQLDRKQTFVGYKLNSDSTIGYFYRQEQLKKAQNKNTANYLIFKKKCLDNWNCTIGLGDYESTYAKKNISMILGLSYKFGDSWALF